MTTGSKRQSRRHNHTKTAVSKRRSARKAIRRSMEKLLKVPCYWKNCKLYAVGRNGNFAPATDSPMNSRLELAEIRREVKVEVPWYLR